MSSPGPPRSEVVAAAADERVVAGAAEAAVVAAAADQHVVAGAADQLVGAGAADQHVVAGPAAHRHRDRHVAGDHDLVVAAAGVDFEAGDRGASQISSFGFAFGLAQTVAADFERDDRVDHVAAAVRR